MSFVYGLCTVDHHVEKILVVESGWRLIVAQQFICTGKRHVHYDEINLPL